MHPNMTTAAHDTHTHARTRDPDVKLGLDLDLDLDLDLSSALPADHVRHLVRTWLREDCPAFDAGAVAAGTAPCVATLYAKSELVLAGAAFFDAVFAELSACSDATLRTTTDAAQSPIRVQWEFHDGAFIRSPPSPSSSASTLGAADAATKMKVPLAKVYGPTHLVLRGERVALNALAECSAVATVARSAVSLAAGSGVRVAGTRKTAPGLRLLQKYGMLVGGVDTHRFDLSAMVMVKDNHVAAASGDVCAAVRRARRVAGFSAKVDVEAATVEEALAAADAGADIVMLDNFSAPDQLAATAKELKRRYPHTIVEASGGVSLASLPRFCVPNVDVVSFSVNRHAAPVDMSLKIDPQ